MTNSERLEIGYEDGFGEKLGNDNIGVFGDSLIDEEEMYSEYYEDNLIDCSEYGETVTVTVDGKIVENVVVDDEVRIDYGVRWEQADLDDLFPNRVM